MIPLRQSTAGQEIWFSVVDDDGVTPVTSNLANTDIKLAKHGATSEANKNSGGSTHVSGGRHYAVLDATDTDTLGHLYVSPQPSGSLPMPPIVCVVMQANVYDSLIAGTTYLETNPGKFSIASTTLSLKNRAGTEDSTRTITATEGADPITGLS